VAGLARKADLWSGLLFLAVGLFVLWAGADLPQGRAGRIGPGYAPRLLALGLCGLGALLLVRSSWARDVVHWRIALRPMILVLGGVLAFALVFGAAGLIPAILALIAVANFAADDNTWTSAVLLGLGMAVFSWLLFVKALGVPIPVLGL
jgi:hypothetical protein